MVDTFSAVEIKRTPFEGGKYETILFGYTYLLKKQILVPVLVLLIDDYTSRYTALYIKP